jgi:hypothetical protein
LAWVTLRKNFRLLFFLAGLPGCLAGQVIIEHAAISGGAATVAGSAKNAANAIGAALKRFDGTLDSAGMKGQSATARAGSAEPQPADAAKPAKLYEDPVAIKTGMSDLELLRRFGEPSMRITGDSGEQTLYYARQDGGGLAQVRVSGGQVLSVDGGGQPAAAVVK